MGLTSEPDDERVMRLALAEARTCLEHGDVPIGAVVTKGDDVLAAAGNRREGEADPTAHAEILAIRAAGAALGSWRLDGCTLTVTLEPCAMCAGAAVLAQARPGRVRRRRSEGGVRGLAREPRCRIHA